jgi:hypothetical protein
MRNKGESIWGELFVEETQARSEDMEGATKLYAEVCGWNEN